MAKMNLKSGKWYEQRVAVHFATDRHGLQCYVGAVVNRMDNGRWAALCGDFGHVGGLDIPKVVSTGHRTMQAAQRAARKAALAELAKFTAAQQVPVVDEPYATDAASPVDDAEYEDA